MYYTYVLLNENDGRFYKGATADLRRRFELHSAGRVRSTAYRRPLKLVYYEVRTAVRTEACLNAEDAYRRERFLKTGKGGSYLKKRLAASLRELRANKLERN